MQSLLLLLVYYHSLLVPKQVIFTNKPNFTLSDKQQNKVADGQTYLPKSKIYPGMHSCFTITD